jgi:hypothetical protein
LRNAVLAYNSGQILAANFQLRTFIEQHIRDITNNHNTKDIDRLFEDYKKKLPNDFLERFPSLHSTYNRFSTDMHTATGDEEVFIVSKGEIEKHFDALRLYDLFPEP